MICLVQRVINSEVSVKKATVGKIDAGMMVLVAFQPEDDALKIEKMRDKLLKYRLFSDENGRMNLNVQQAAGQILLVPQFTLAADTNSGLRPSFSSCAAPEIAKQQFDEFYILCKQAYPNVEKGEFGADMQVSLVNDGPVTFWLEN